MKITFNTYLYLVLVLSLNVFVNAQANDLTSNIEQKAVAENYKVLQNSSEKATYHHTATASFNPVQKETEHRVFFDLIESDEVENEESQSSKKSHNSDHQNTAFINAQVFELFSKELQKNIRCYPSTVNVSSTRLYLRFQVFII
jgi:hypothetical protein